jgi:hypothetical protein
MRVSAIPKAGLILPTSSERWRIYLVAIIWFGVPMAVFAFLGFYLLKGYGNPSWAPWVAAGLEALFAAGLIYVAVRASLNLGVSLDDRGVVYYCYAAIRPSWAIRRRILWQDLNMPLIGSGNIAFDTPIQAIQVTLTQARVVVSDTRYPLKLKLDGKTRLKLGMVPTEPL